MADISTTSDQKLLSLAVKHLSSWATTTAELSDNVTFLIFYDIDKNKVNITQDYIAQKLLIDDPTVNKHFELKWTVSMRKVLEESDIMFECEATLQLIVETLYQTISFPVSISKQTMDNIMEEFKYPFMIGQGLSGGELRSFQTERFLEQSEIIAKGLPSYMSTVKQTEEINKWHFQTWTAGRKMLSFLDQIANISTKKNVHMSVRAPSITLYQILEIIKKHPDFRCESINPSDITTTDLANSLALHDIFDDSLKITIASVLESSFDLEKEFSDVILRHTGAIWREVDFLNDKLRLSVATKSTMKLENFKTDESLSPAVRCIKSFFAQNQPIHQAILYVQLYAIETLVMRRLMGGFSKTFKPVLSQYFDYIEAIYRDAEIDTIAVNQKLIEVLVPLMEA